MPLTAEHHHIAGTIDQYVHQTLADGGGDESILQSMADHMNGFKRLMDTTIPAEMDELCQRYSGFYHFAQLLEQLATGIASGQIKVPK